jgi:hypothetical protein
MDQTKLCINEAIIQMHLFSHVYKQNGIGKLIEYQEQEPPFGGKTQIDPTLVFEFQW